MHSQIINADVVEGLRSIPDHSVQCVVTSPPYFNLRSYGIEPRHWDDGTVSVLGEEQTVDMYVQHLVQIFRELKRVLHPSGTFWPNIGDCYAGGVKHLEPVKYPDAEKPVRPKQKGMSGKNLLMIPAQVALALRADGWILRQDNIWHKPNPMPESTHDRTTWAYEHVFQLALNEHYYYDADAIAEPVSAISIKRYQRVIDANEQYDPTKHKHGAGANPSPMDVLTRGAARILAKGTRNKRNVWTIPVQPFRGAHFACFPERLVDVCIRAGSKPGDIVLDPFCGSGRAGIVAQRLGRSFIGIDQSANYCDMSRRSLGIGSTESATDRVLQGQAMDHMEA